MKRLMLLLIVFTALKTKAQGVEIKSFHIETRLTDEALKYLKDNSKGDTLNYNQQLPDSIPLEAICVFELSEETTQDIYLKIGSISGLGDIFDESFTLLQTKLVPKSNLKRLVYRYQLGTIYKTNTFTAFIWLNGVDGKPAAMLRYIKI